MNSMTATKISTNMISKDPIGKALLDYYRLGNAEDIRVESDVIDDDVLPVDYLFRDESELPELELIALSNVKGKTLDVGGCSGVHSIILLKNGINVEAIDISEGAVEVMSQRGINARQIDFFELEDNKYDTLLFLMNGTGVAGTKNRFLSLLEHARTLLNPGGQILIDSTDIRYVYEDEEGGVWIDLNGSYYGEVEFKMSYKNESGDWFTWLYLDENTMAELATQKKYKMSILHREEEQFLAKLELM